jgi:hypothetical protein
MVVEVHDADAQRSSFNIADGVSDSEPPKPMPYIVTIEPPDVAAFGVTAEIAGASKVSTPTDDPTTATTLTMMRPSAPVGVLSWHTRDVAETHEAVGHAVAPISTVGDMITFAKFKPRRDRETPADIGTLRKIAAVITGASKVHVVEVEPTKLETVVLSSNAAPPAAGLLIANWMVVAEVHVHEPVTTLFNSAV